jgi:O-antigen/teichoic acid export membrane protein
MQILELKRKVFKGGIYLVLRQLLGAVMALVGALVVARILGPKDFGIVGIAMSVFYFTTATSKLGLNIYIIRQPELQEKEAAQILAFYNTVGVAFCALMWFLAPLIGSLTGHPDTVTPVVRCLVPIVWLDMVGGLNIGLLERNLRFAEVGTIEMLAQVANTLLSVSLVLLNYSYWGPVAGLAAQFLIQAILGAYYQPIRWQLRWQWSSLMPALRYSLGYTGCTWLWSFKSLTVPLLVSRLAGLEAVGILTMANRLTANLGTLWPVVERLSISGLAKLNNEPELTRQVISRGMVYQGLVVGPFEAIFSCLSIWAIPLMLGGSWMPSIQVFPFIAFVWLVYAVFTLHISALFVVGLNHEVAKAYLWHLGLLWLSTLILVPTYGLWGYAAAEIVALLSYFSLHRSLKKQFGMPDYSDSFWLLAATLPPLMLGPSLPIAFGLGVFVVSYGFLFLLRPGLRKVPTELYAAWRGSPSPQPT